MSETELADARGAETALVEYRTSDDVTAIDALTTEQLVQQVATIQHAMGAVMKQDEHYGIIPGTTKPTLFKAGAEKLCLLFRLAPTYKIERAELPNGHVEFTITCTLLHQPTGMFVGEGVGLCSSMESKYRYRKNRVETEIPVPSEYWDAPTKQERDPTILRDAIKKARAEGANIMLDALDVSYGTTKNANDKWVVCLHVHGEHPDIADTYNTVLKIAKKRALVDAVLTSTAASDCFTQDLEDMPQFASRETWGMKLIRKAAESGFSRLEVEEALSGRNLTVDELTEDQYRALMTAIVKRATQTKA